MLSNLDILNNRTTKRPRKGDMLVSLLGTHVWPCDMHPADVYVNTGLNVYETVKMHGEEVRPLSISKEHSVNYFILSSEGMARMPLSRFLIEIGQPLEPEEYVPYLSAKIPVRRDVPQAAHGGSQGGQSVGPLAATPASQGAPGRVVGPESEGQGRP